MGNKRLDQATKADIIYILYRNSCLDKENFMADFNERRNAFNETRNRSLPDGATPYRTDLKGGRRELNSWTTGHKMQPYQLDSDMASTLLIQQADGNPTLALKSLLLRLEERAFDVRKYRERLESEEDDRDFAGELYNKLAEEISIYAFSPTEDSSTHIPSPQEPTPPSLTNQHIEHPDREHRPASNQQTESDFLEILNKIDEVYNSVFHKRSTQEDVQRFLNWIAYSGAYYNENKNHLSSFQEEYELFYKHCLNFKNLWNSFQGRTFGEVSSEIKLSLEVMKTQLDRLIQLLQKHL